MPEKVAFGKKAVFSKAICPDFLDIYIEKVKLSVLSALTP